MCLAVMQWKCVLFFLEASLMLYLYIPMDGGINYYIFHITIFSMQVDVSGIKIKSSYCTIYMYVHELLFSTILQSVMSTESCYFMSNKILR